MIQRHYSYAKTTLLPMLTRLIFFFFVCLYFTRASVAAAADGAAAQTMLDSLRYT